ncbi:MAG: DUF438 domain-containing protein [Elusimicrobia bacterium]|nr:DUF438 domain-containing protein [Elusimicrobiota bacterium]
MTETTEHRKQILKDILLKLHKGLSAKEAKMLFEEKIGEVTSNEIFEIEQALIKDGISPDEIKKFCNVHALLFESSIKTKLSDTNNPNHPVSLFKLENREIEKILASIKDAAKEGSHAKAEILKNLLLKLKEVEIHYARKEQVLFPHLEKIGFYGPSKVMWGKDNEIRELLRNSVSSLERKNHKEADKLINALVEEIEGMIFKEENILFPTCLEKLKTEDWISVLKESPDAGYAFIRAPEDTGALLEDFKRNAAEEPYVGKNNEIILPSGSVTTAELMNVLNTMPFDITFVDKNDAVKYYSEGRDRIFLRTRSVIGRKVQNCHPPQSLEAVEKILRSFKDGSKDFYEFWINLVVGIASDTCGRGTEPPALDEPEARCSGRSAAVPKGKLIHIRYFAVRDLNKNYLGALEVTQDITGIKKIQGEKRLLEEK